MEIDKWIVGLRNVCRMIRARGCSIEQETLELLGLDSETLEVQDDSVKFEGVLKQLTLPISTLYTVVIDHPDIPRDAKYVFRGDVGISLSINGSKVNGCTEVFHIDRMQFNLVDHMYYSPHRLLKGDERQRVLDKFGSNLELYPKIDHSDPVVKYFAWDIGDLIEITIDDGPEYAHNVKYRVVI